MTVPTISPAPDRPVARMDAPQAAPPWPVGVRTGAPQPFLACAGLLRARGPRVIWVRPARVGRAPPAHLREPRVEALVGDAAGVDIAQELVCARRCLPLGGKRLLDGLAG